MPKKIAEGVISLIDEAGRVERESESVYLKLGEIFERLSSEMEKSAELGERSIGKLTASGHRGFGPEFEGQDFVKDATKYFATLRERDMAFLGRINEGIARLDALEEIIARLRADSEEMEIISLNAMTVALKSGAEGKAFSVITDELKRLSGRTIQLAEGVTASGRSLLEFFGRLRAALSELDAFQHDFFDLLGERYVSGYERLDRDFSGASGFFSSLLGEARGVREPVLRVMGEVQLQDIVRQSLQHVGISLAEARQAVEADDGPSAMAFVAAVAELSQSLVGETIAKLEASAQAFDADLEAVRAIVEACERQRSRFLADSAPPTEAGGGAGEASSAYDADADGFRSASGRYVDVKRDVTSMAGRLDEHVVGLDRSFKGLAVILGRFQNIVIASRIEVAKNRALAGVATTVGEMITLTERIEEDVGKAMDTTKDFKMLASDAIAGYAFEGEGASERLVATLARIERGLADLGRARESMHEAIRGFSLYTDGFVRLVSRAGEETGRLRGLVARLGSVGASLGGLRDSIRASLGPGGAEVEPERMRRMVERFTIFTHKKAAGDIARFAVEEGVDAGEVTLF
jgi:hypothetical protein